MFVEKIEKVARPVMFQKVTLDCAGNELGWLISAIKQAARPQASFTPDARAFFAGLAATLEAREQEAQEKT